jgi:uncharacterized membrane protein YccC
MSALKLYIEQQEQSCKHIEEEARLEIAAENEIKKARRQQEKVNDLKIRLNNWRAEEKKRLDDTERQKLHAVDHGTAKSVPKWRRTTFKHHQLREMKAHFIHNKYPDSRELQKLSQQTGLDKTVLRVR